MKTYQVTQREGELLGPIDWSYNFRQHFDGWGVSDAEKDRMCERAKEMLRQIEIDSTTYQVVSAHGFSWQKVLAVGMYDGWPYWKPTPAYMILGPLGSGEWQFFYDLRQVMKFEVSNA